MGGLVFGTSLRFGPLELEQLLVGDRAECGEWV